MGLIKNALDSMVEEAVIGVGLAAVAGALEVVETAAEGVSAAGGFISDTIGKVIDQQNLADLKKQSKKQEYCLFVTREDKLGTGIYRITDKKKEEKYNTLFEGADKKNFTIHLYSKVNGEIANITKRTTVQKSLFSTKVNVVYSLWSNIYSVGNIVEAKEGNQKVYKTDFNDWIITGDFPAGNYKIFDIISGKTIAAVTKKYKIASSYVVDCEYDENEAVIALLTVFIDFIEREEKQSWL